MNRPEALRAKIATVIQATRNTAKSSYEIAGQVQTAIAKARRKKSTKK